jgi:hypothetical protein
MIRKPFLMNGLPGRQLVLRSCGPTRIFNVFVTRLFPGQEQPLRPLQDHILFANHFR